MQTKVCNTCGKELPATTEYFHKSKENRCGLKTTCKMCRSIIRKEGSNKEYYESHREEILKYQQGYRLTRKDKIRDYFKKYEKTETRKKNYITKGHRKKALDKKLQATFTIEDWIYCKKYFNNKCAYCGKETNLEQEHFIPLSKGGGYTKNNIIPVCSFCNNSKHSRSFYLWYPKQNFYDKERENKILKYLALK